jgi:hypothetical protein
MKMTALASCHLSSDIKKKSISDFLRLICLRAHIFLTHLFWVSLLKNPFILGFFYKYYLLLQTYKSSVSSKKTTNESPIKNVGIFHFVITESWQAIPHGFTWVLKASPNFSTSRFGLFHGNSSIKRRLLQPQRAD